MTVQKETEYFETQQMSGNTVVRRHIKILMQSDGKRWHFRDCHIGLGEMAQYDVDWRNIGDLKSIDFYRIDVFNFIDMKFVDRNRIDIIDFFNVVGYRSDVLYFFDTNRFDPGQFGNVQVRPFVDC